MSNEPKNGWIASENNFSPVKVLTEGETHRTIEIDGKAMGFAGSRLPQKNHFPAIYYGDTKPEVFSIGGRSLPKVDINSFPNPEQAKALIPEYEPYHFPVEDTASLIDGILLCDHTLVYGPTGTGKTSRILQLANRIGQPVIRINFNAQVSPSDLTGFMGFGEGGTVWYDGLVPLAMENGYWLLLDEFDFCPPEVGSVLYPVLEKVSQITLKEHPQGKVVRGVRYNPWEAERKIGFRIFATGNSFGSYGSSDDYNGTQDQNKALLNRFSGHGRIIELAAMNKREERKVLKQRCPWLPETLASRALNFAERVRRGGEQERAVLPTFSLRELINWMEKALVTKNVIRAADMTFLTLIPEESTKQALRDTLVAMVGRKVIVRNPSGVLSERKAPTKKDKGAKVHASTSGSGRTPSRFFSNDNPNMEAEFEALLDDRIGGMGLVAINAKYNLSGDNGYTAWSIVNKTPKDIAKKFEEKVKLARERRDKRGRKKKTEEKES